MDNFGTKLARDVLTVLRTPCRLNVGAQARSFHTSQFLFVVADLCGIASGALLVGAVHYRHIEHRSVPRLVMEQIGVAILYAILILLFSHTQRLYAAYQSISPARECIAIFKAILMATAVLNLYFLLTGIKSTSRFIISCSACTALITMWSWRQLRRRTVRKAMADGLLCHNVLIIGTDYLAQAVAQHLTLHRHLGFVVLGHLTVESGEPHPAKLKILGSAAQLTKYCRIHFIDEILICAHHRPTVIQIIEEAQHCGVGVRVIPDLYDGIAWGARIDHLGDFPSLTIIHRSKPALAMAAKRILDTVFSAAALCLLSPLLVLLALIVKLDSEGPVFYASRRAGKRSRPFSCYKLRTMVADADALQKGLEHLNEREGVLFKISNDPRITRIGLFLRKHSLDELPQFWNVLRGDMSLVGPRPPLVSEFEQYKLNYLRRLEVAPGITGLWQVEARNNPSFDRYLSLDLTYIENWSLSLDLRILMRTVAVVFAGTGT